MSGCRSKSKEYYLFASEFGPALAMKVSIKLVEKLGIEEIDETIAYVALIFYITR
jgi:hypothetical protein